jgi:hypothetical protein
MRFLSIKNFERYQHYKDRRPPWIKLHASILDDYEWMQLPDASKAHLMLLWVLASQMDNKIPHDLAWLTQRIGARSPVDVEELILRGFLEPWNDGRARGKLENWHSRYVSAQTRAALLSAAQHKCAACGSAEKLEIDHVVPISQGGTGDFHNLQVLCRQCNRKKRARLRDGGAPIRYADAETRAQPQRSLETEAERETEAEYSRRTRRVGGKPARPVARPSSGFDLAPYIDAHREAFPGSTPPAGRYGRVFKQLEAAHGRDEVLRRFRICLAVKRTFGTPEELAAHWSEYGEAPAAPVVASTMDALRREYGSWIDDTIPVPAKVPA